MATPAGLYAIRIKGRLGATALFAFPAMESEVEGGETVLTGRLEDQSELFGVLWQIEALGLELVEVRTIHSGPAPPEGAKPRTLDGPRRGDLSPR